MRWLAGFMGLMLLLGVGCTRQCFVAEDEFYQAHHLPANLHADPHAVVQPLIPPSAAPATVDYPERPERFLTLQEAIAIALENGLPSGRVNSPGGPGAVRSDDNLLSASGNAGGSGVTQLTGQTDRLRVIALQPALAAANIEASLARFDATWTTSMNWTNTDNLQQGLTSFQNGQRAQFATSIFKAFSAGGVANVSFLTDYQMLTTPPTGTFNVINPLYTARLNLGIEQPLWQNYGADINQLLASFPFPEGSASLHQRGSSFFTSHLQGRGVLGAFGQVEGILLARLRFDQQRAEFERNVHTLLLNVELAYWNLYQSYGQLYSFEEVKRLAHKAWMDASRQFEVGRRKPEEFHSIRAQYEEFRGERFKALGNVLDAERFLRGILGLPLEDGTRLVPITPPVLAAYAPDWHGALTDAMTHRPELVIARDNVRAAQFQVITQYNFLKPDLRFVANITPTGFGTRLDGPGTFTDGTGTDRTNNAFRSLASSHFNDWLLGLTLNVPLGFRAENAALRQAKIALGQSYMVLKDQEEKTTRFLGWQWQKIFEYYRLIEARRNEREAYGKAVEVRFRQFLAGQAGANIPIVELLLESQRRLVLAQIKEYEAIAEYNNVLARFEWAKGTILQHNNVLIAEGALPMCAQIRAVEYERERSKALVLCERPEPLRHPGLLAVDHKLPPLDAPVPANHNGVVRTGVNFGPAPASPLKISDRPAAENAGLDVPLAPADDNAQAKPPMIPPSSAGDLVIIPTPVMDPNSENSPWRKSANPALPAVFDGRTPLPSKSPTENGTTPAPSSPPGLEGFRPLPTGPAPPRGLAPQTPSGVHPADFRPADPRPMASPPLAPEAAGFSPVPPQLNESAIMPATLPPPLP